MQFNCRALDSLSRSRQVIAEAEGLTKGDNPRLVVTDLPKTLQESIQHVYETICRIRGDMDYVA